MLHQRTWNTTLLMVGLVLANSLQLRAQAPMVSARDGMAASGLKLSAHDTNTAATEMPATPAPQRTLQSMPPQAPRVTYQYGMLSISASNSTLGQVLRAVEAETGASVDFPADEASERVAAQLGPGTPTEILVKLLNGSKFNYIILGMPGDSGQVQKLMLTVPQRTESVTISSAQNNSPSPTPVAATSEPKQVDAANQLQRAQRWNQIAQQHAQRMSDPANQNAGPPPPPPMESPPPSQ